MARLMTIVPVVVAAAFLAGCGSSLGPSEALQANSIGTARGDETSLTKSTGNSAATRELRKIAMKASESNKAGASGYKIGPQDLLEVSVFKVPELSKTVQVSENGTMNYPLIGETVVSGKTARDVEIDLTRRLGESYLQNPQVSVRVSEFNSQRVTMEGAVKKPGIYPLQGNMTLIQVLALAQGLNDISDGTVVVFRDVEGKRQVARFNVSELRSGSGKDPQLRAGDVIVANSSQAQQFFNRVIKALPLAGAFALL